MAIDPSTVDPNNPDWWSQNQPPAPSATSTLPPSTKHYPNPSLQAIADAYRQYLGRDASDEEVIRFGTDIDQQYLSKIIASIQNSPEAAAYAKKQAGTTTPTTPGTTTTPNAGDWTGPNGLKLSAADRAQIDQYLKDSESTDDPTYWYTLAAQHGGVASTGAEWLKDRIYRGDGSKFVKNGSMQKFSDTPSGGPMAGGFNWTAPNFTPVTLPTQAEVEATPGFQFARDQGIQAIGRQNASHGTYLSGGTDKDVANYVTGLSNQYYQNAVNNQLGITGFNNAGALNQFGANLGAQNQWWTQGFNENQNAFNQYNTNQQQAFLQWLALANLGNPGNPYA